MDLSIFMQINYIAVTVSAIVFFFVGSAWFSPLLFTSMWLQELKQHNVVIKEPTAAVLTTKMLLTFAANFVTSLAMAYLVALTASTTITSGLCLGIIAAVGFTLTSIGSVFIWEGRSLRLFLIDAGYPAVGIILSAILLSIWQ